MKAIKTSYYPPTNSRGSRVKADDGDKNIVWVSWNYALDIEENHKKAMFELCNKMGWSNNMIKGWYKDAYYWVWSNAK